MALQLSLIHLFCKVPPHGPSAGVPGEPKIQTFDVVQGTIEETPFDFQSVPILSPSGTYALFTDLLRSEGEGNDYAPYWRPIIRTLDAKNELTIPIELTAYYASWSADGKCLVTLSPRNRKWEMGLLHLNGGQYDTWTFPSEIEISPEGLSPDGHWLVGRCSGEMCVMKPNGEIVYHAPEVYRFIKWSPDSHYILIGENEGKISYLEANSDWSKRKLIDETNCQSFCSYFGNFNVSSWSPDGTKLAGFISQPGIYSFFIIEFPSGNINYSPIDLRHPIIWSPVGDQLAGFSLGDGVHPRGIYKMAANGSHLEMIKKIEFGQEPRPLFWTSGE